MISIIIPYYNPDSDRQLELLLKRAVSSAVSQFGEDDEYEVIVVDDGSPVPPEFLTDSFDGGRVILIKAAHGRLGAARNRGLEASSGELVTFLDADDCYFPDSLKPCIDAMQRESADLLLFRFAAIYENGIKVPEDGVFHFQSPVTGSDYMKRTTPFGSSCMYVIRKSLLTDNGLQFAENTYMEDEDFTPRMLFFSRRLVISDATVYAYYRRRGSITNSDRYDERAANTLNVIRRLQNFQKEHSSSDCSGIIRKIRFLAMDHIRLTLRRPDWKESLPVQMSALADIGLWPLPKAAYGFRYRVFRMLSGCRTGIRIMHLIEKRYTS